VGTHGRLRFADLRTGAQVADVTLDAAVAHTVHDVRLSPDGARAALHTTTVVEHRFVLVDLATARVS
jgi:hypothetical protein